MAPRHTPAQRHKNASSRERISALGVISPPPIRVETPTFDGSLGTLFACVKDRKIDLLQVPLFPICEAYFSYLIGDAHRNLDEAAAALGALAYLLERKAWMLLPTPTVEPEPDEAMELPEPSTGEFAVAVESLRRWHEERSILFFRSPEAGPDPYELPYTLGNVSVEDLARAFERLMRRAQPELSAMTPKPRQSLEEMMRLVLAAISGDWQTLHALISPPFTRADLVYWFLALLELIRVGLVKAQVANDDVEFART